MTRIKLFFTEHWKGKFVSLLVAFSIWYLIKSHLDSERVSFPVPGTGSPPVRTTTTPTVEESILNPLTPPIPGSE